MPSFLPVVETVPAVVSSGPTALVLGATGGIGSAVARRLLALGWQVRALHRQAALQRPAAGLDWCAGDAMVEADVVRAAQGCAVIVHAVNPPGYRRWATRVLPMIDNTIAAARRQGALIVLPGTVYNYGPGLAQPVVEDAAQAPITRKGAIRVALEQRLAVATTQGVRALILRAGDYFGPGAANNWFGQGLVRPGQLLRTVYQPGQAGVGHSWAYLPDVAETLVQLVLRRADLPAFARFHVAGHWDADGQQMVRTIVAVAQQQGLQPVVRPFPWWLVWLGAPVLPTLRELLELRDLWRTPLALDGSLLQATLGQVPHTPWGTAVAATLVGLGCLPSVGASQPPSC